MTPPPIGSPFAPQMQPQSVSVLKSYILQCLGNFNCYSVSMLTSFQL
jgi:hypothetical protein